MATTVKLNHFATGVRLMPEPMGSELVSIRCAAKVAGGIVSGDVIKLGEIPANAVVVDYVLDNDDLDANGVPTLAADLGVLNAAGTAISADAADGGKWRTAATVLQAAAVTRASAASAAEQTALLRMQPKPADRIVALVATANAATAHAGDGEIGLTLVYRSAYLGN